MKLKDGIICKKIKLALHEAASEALGEQENQIRKHLDWWFMKLKTFIKNQKNAYHIWFMTEDNENRKLYSRISRIKRPHFHWNTLVAKWYV